MHRFPQKFEISDKMKGEFFEKRYFYISIETEVDLDISLTACSKEIPLGQIKSIKLLNFMNDLRAHRNRSKNYEDKDKFKNAKSKDKEFHDKV